MPHSRLSALDEHFRNAEPVVRETFDRLMAALDRLGGVTADPKKTCIHLTRKSALGGVRVCQGWLLLELKSDGPIDSRRITHSDQITRNRWHHTVKLEGPDSVDAELESWLAAAYALSG